MADLAYTVWVKPEGSFEPVSFGPGDKNIPDWALEQMGDHCFVDGRRPKPSGKAADPSDYGTWKQAALKAEIDKRNEGRESSAQLSKTGNNAALAAALTVDDHLQAKEYDSLHVDDLKAEIDRRNADREDTDQVSAAGNKPDLVASLQADDEKQA